MPQRVLTVKQHVTPYGIAEQRRVITVPDEVPLTAEELKTVSDAEAIKQFAAAKRTLKDKADRQREHEESHADTDATDDVHQGKAGQSAELLKREGPAPFDPHSAASTAEVDPLLPVAAPEKQKKGRKKKA
jgi:hypothetical protein